MKSRRRLLAVGAATAALLATAVTLGTLRTGIAPKTDFWATLKASCSPFLARTRKGYMQDINDEELIQAAVPERVTVNHKYGLVEGYVHDAAVLSSGGASYALAIYTWGAEDADSPAGST